MVQRRQLQLATSSPDRGEISVWAVNMPNIPVCVLKGHSNEACSIPSTSSGHAMISGVKICAAQNEISNRWEDAFSWTCEITHDNLFNRHFQNHILCRHFLKLSQHISNVHLRRPYYYLPASSASTIPVYFSVESSCTTLFRIDRNNFRDTTCWSCVVAADLLAEQKWNEWTCFRSVRIKLCSGEWIEREWMWLHCMCLKLEAYDVMCTNWMSMLINTPSQTDKVHVRWVLVGDMYETKTYVLIYMCGAIGV